MPDAEQTRYRVYAQVVVQGFVDIPANGTRAAARKVRALLTMDNNPTRHMEFTRAPIVETAKRGEELPDD